MHSPTGSGFRPPAPTPQPRPLGPLALLKALRTNPLECWTRAHFEQPTVLGGFPFARVAVVSDPAAIRQVLVEDKSAYCKSPLERRVMAAHMPNGLVTVDGEHWHRLRRLLAPMFGRKMTAGFAPAMTRVAAALVERLQSRRDGSVWEIKTEMSRVALDVLIGCIFSDGLGDAEAIRAAATRYFATSSGIDPFDVIGLPDFVPRLTRLRVRHAAKPSTTR